MRGSYADLQMLKQKEKEKDKDSSADGILSPSQLQYAPVYQRKPFNTQFVSGSQFPTTDNSFPSNPPSPGLHRRSRKSSLSDRVPVEMIAYLDPVDTFEDSTKRLNDDMEKVS
jgi:hypothetical protein